MKTRKYVSWVGGIAFLLVVSNFAIDYFIESDPDFAIVQDYVIDNSNIISRFGKVEQIQVTRLTHVSASAGSGSYKLFSLHITGAQDRGSIEVKVIEDSKVSPKKIIQLGR